MPAAIANRGEIMDAIVALIADGKTHREIAAMEGMPGRRTIDDWVAADEEFRTRCARARAESAGLFEAKVEEIAGKVEREEMPPDAGRAAANMYQWLAMVRDRSRYGDKVDVTHKGKIEVVPVVNLTINGPAPRIIEHDDGGDDGVR